MNNITSIIRSIRNIMRKNGTTLDDDLLIIKRNGDIGIGTTDPQSKLAIDGQIRATEVKVLADISVPDYVFEPDYELRTLKETKDISRKISTFLKFHPHQKLVRTELILAT